MAKTYEALQKESQPSSGWRFLDLKNKKQSGDLEKKIFQLWQKKACKVFNFTSSRGQEGVSTIIANLAQYIKYNKIDKKVLLIDANFHHPHLHTIFNTPLGQGLTDVLDNSISLDESINQLDSSNLSLLTCGQTVNRETDNNIGQETLDSVLTNLRKQFDYILIDSAPVLASANATTLATSSDVTFLIIQSLKVKKEVAEKTKNILQDNECLIGGVILNRLEQVIPEWVYKFI